MRILIFAIIVIGLCGLGAWWSRAVARWTLRRVSKPLPTDRFGIVRAVVNAMQPSFIEQWVSGTYLVCGVFPTRCSSVTVQEMEAKLPGFYEEVRRHQERRWPRGLAGYYVIPIYIAPGFSSEVVAWVHGRHPYRWAIWHEPVLYDLETHTVEMRADYGAFGSVFTPYLFRVIDAALRALSRHHGRSHVAAINGQPL